ncbi:hypothetical protein BS78_09G107300 [Paspalum vaginatum]|nr:hypothetical protein BS78_09G107300 [Paspalum vaginatum]
MLDRRSWLLQMDAPLPPPRAGVIRAQPRPVIRLPFAVETVNRGCPWTNGASPPYRSDSTPDILDVILSENDPDRDSSSQVGFLCGSPPVRPKNPVIHDPMFGRRVPSFSPLASSYCSSKMPAGRVEATSPSNDASSCPKARI